MWLEEGGGEAGVRSGCPACVLRGRGRVGVWLLVRDRMHTRGRCSQRHWGGVMCMITDLMLCIPWGSPAMFGKLLPSKQSWLQVQVHWQSGSSAVTVGVAGTPTNQPEGGTKHAICYLHTSDGPCTWTRQHVTHVMMAQGDRVHVQHMNRRVGAYLMVECASSIHNSGALTGSYST
jgi:hypothetical protein